jgi:hypothetical protein
MVTACIVGHSPLNHINGLGKIIDSHDFVIRMINCGWQKEEEEKYGTKYNIGIFCPGQPKLNQACEQWIPSDFWFRYEPNKEGERQDGKIEFDKVTMSYAADSSIAKLSPAEFKHLTRGGAAVILAGLYLEGLENILMVGCGKLNPKSTATAHHPVPLRKIHPLTGDPNNAHDWDAEHAILQAFCLGKGIELEFIG